MTDLSVIVVSYNTKDLLRACLASVQNCAGNLSMEVLVVDNSSRDGSADMVAAEFPSARLLRNPDNRGFAAANNQALAVAAGRYLMLLNSDTVVRPGAFAAMMAFMDAHPQAGYCGPKLLNGDGSHQPSARRFPTPLSGAFAMTGLSVRRPASRHSLDLHAAHGTDQPFRADWLCGACLMVRREAIARVGVLDECFFLYFEETDWCRRMAAAGWEGWYIPAAEVLHWGGRSVDQNRATAPFSGDHPVHWLRSRRRYMRRYHGVAGSFITETVEVGLNALIWARHCWRGNVESRQKALRASRTIRHVLQDRRGDAGTRRRGDTERGLNMGCSGVCGKP